ncbi:hypothetical protein UlMin_034819 [Ulmus minor]
MGSCFSKCKPKKHSKQEEQDQEFFQHVQDKQVIATKPPSINIPISLLNKISPSPPSPSANSTSSSVSSFTCSSTSANHTSISSSTSSTASSILTSKDRSFSNEFLYSCFKENPHIIRINSIKDSASKQTTYHNHQRVSTTSQKRVRSKSPTLTRQKSFRRDYQPEKPSSPYNNSLPSRTLRSPSPSRRFVNGDHKGGGVFTNTQIKECHSKRSSSSSVASYLKKEQFLRPASPNNCSSTRLVRPYLRSSTINREAFVHRIGSKIDEIAVGEALTQHELDTLPMEDIDNPLISLDCFIFL